MEKTRKTEVRETTGEKQFFPREAIERLATEKKCHTWWQRAYWKRFLEKK